MTSLHGSPKLPSQHESAMTDSRPQPDEGFSEEARSPTDSEELYMDPDEDLINRMLLLSDEKRKYLAQLLIQSLPNADKDDLGALCKRLTHFDPVSYLPNELILLVLSFLEPPDLLSCSQVSRAWHGHARDERLWRRCFAQEGWVVDTNKTALFESRPYLLDHDKRGSRKRAVAEAFGGGERFFSHMRPVGSIIGNVSDGDPMEGIEDSEPNTSPTSGNPFGRVDKATSDGLQFDTPMFRQNITECKLSWPYLYKQRFRLEKNWENGVYKTFQLPDPSHPQDGHLECVYTIQHTSKHLVSGSRDKTIRIWDLDEKRLKNHPTRGRNASVLRGHIASVLCLQFDERPEHDIIVSGGSDNWVIIWKFSTGEILKKMTDAHKESVLNLRFDDRYIVTCSKDKQIKIWNRRAVDQKDDMVPIHYMARPGETVGDKIGNTLIKEYSLLSTLEGHGAAVNAVMIFGDKVVSASGDRTLRAWDIRAGEHIKNYIGHAKGIACVQFDGRRIVSGSSDNTVRIFDAETQAEVACLNGHHNLVRTVQARFGDLATVSDEELQDESRQADNGFFQALEAGMVTHDRPRNAGSYRPDAMTAYGTKIPPGGGGSKWSRIVSGSYDETIIIWRKVRSGKEKGNWKESRRLNQAHHILQQRSNARARPQQGANAQVVPVHPQGAAMMSASILNQVQQGFITTNIQNALPQHALPIGHAGPSQSSAQNLQGQQPTLQGASTHPQGIQGPAAPVVNAILPAGTIGTGPQVGANAAAHLQGLPRPESHRVFKLQFDPRRIISCSQNRIIAGWDFANGDPDLENIGRWSVETP